MQTRATFGVVILILSRVSTAAPQSGYEVVRSVNVSSFSGNVGATGLNSNADASVTHWNGSSAFPLEDAYVWTAAGLTGIAGSSTVAIDIGLNSEVVGTTTSGGLSFAWRRPGTTLIPLGTYGSWTSTIAEGVNASGAIVGMATDAAQTGFECFVWQGGVFTPLALTPGFTTLRARDINGMGDVGGQLVTAQGRRTAGVWRQGLCIDLTPNSSEGIVEALNDAGEATGTYVGPQGFSGFVSRAGGLAPFALPNAFFSTGTDINNSGTAVGQSLLGGELRAMVQYDDTTFDLNDLVLAEGLTLHRADAINDNGYIAAFASEGSVNCLVLLAPTCGAVSYCTPSTTSEGCVSSSSSTGAASASSGAGFSLNFTALSGQRSGLVFYGVSGRDLVALTTAKGLLCVKGPVQRTPVGNTGGTSGGCDGMLTLDWNAFMAGAPSALGSPRMAGQRVQAQAWHRDPVGVKPAALTRALEFVLCP